MSCVLTTTRPPSYVAVSFSAIDGFIDARCMCMGRCVDVLYIVFNDNARRIMVRMVHTTQPTMNNRKCLSSECGRARARFVYDERRDENIVDLN